MKLPNYTKLLNFLWYQSVWFTAILGREAFEPVLFVLLGLHLFWCDNWRGELRLMLGCGLLGVLADSVLSLAGLYLFDPTPTVLPIPLWLVGLWLGFAGTLNHSMSYLVSRPWLASAASLAAAPLSYFAGERFGAVTFGLDAQAAAITIGATWAVLMFMFTKLAAGQKNISLPQNRNAAQLRSA
ncbi:MAG: DUF2878 domain-containing protein [Kordiimonadaceae bacterium]|nr:DUF2878 domain-containing protein [Kordiimonadaceae bacterium]MBO6568726.1 DUF2878 domain-containing protein [Kordiimonadaceae bacterium]MBO6965298.1 DUF2878 domain-containing protein [Kordiimonadaceae bacterium]